MAAFSIARIQGIRVTIDPSWILIFLLVYWLLGVVF